MKGIAAKSLSGLLTTLCVLGACSLWGDPQREIVDTDAQTFETVVRSQLADSGAIALGFLRVDPRPAIDNPIPSAVAQQSPPLVLPDSSGIPTTATANRIIRNRDGILEDLHVSSGGPFSFPECGGTRRVIDPGGLLGTVKCPREPLRYVAVGMPYRGAAPILAKLRRPETPAPDSSAELWTVLVSETNTGPGGQRWQQHAWLFHRDQQTGRLVVGERFLLSWAD